MGYTWDGESLGPRRPLCVLEAPRRRTGRQPGRGASQAKAGTRRGAMCAAKLVVHGYTSFAGAAREDVQASPASHLEVEILCAGRAGQRSRGRIADEPPGGGNLMRRSCVCRHACLPVRGVTRGGRGGVRCAYITNAVVMRTLSTTKTSVPPPRRKALRSGHLLPASRFQVSVYDHQTQARHRNTAAT